MSYQLHLCKPHYENLLLRELTSYDLAPIQQGKGWILVQGQQLPIDLTFAIFSVFEIMTFKAESVNAFAEQAIEYFWQNNRNNRITQSWPFCLETADEPGLAGRKKILDEVITKKLSGKMSRIAKLASRSLPTPNQLHQGLFLFIPDFEEIFVGCSFFFWGQHRVKDDPSAPSRSFLKVEEAYQILGPEPQIGDLVTDLGAAPGGWSLSAANRGAYVTAIDNGPLKGGALNHPHIKHLMQDAFRFIPQETQDWLFCDMIENPYRIIGEILLPWITQGYTQRFIINFKVGKCDPIELLNKVKTPSSRFNLTKHCQDIAFRQLFHDREEITCVGIIK